MFQAIRPFVRGAALAFCHVETPIGAGRAAVYPVLNSPPELARAIAWTGWDVCSTASNHSADKGQHGIERTALALDAAGVRHTGSFRSPAEARRILIVRVHGVRIAFLAFAYGTNLSRPNSWSVNVISRRKVVADARRARRQGADLVIVNFHWGKEYVHAPNAQQRSLAHYLLTHRVVDVIIGQHTHVVQPISRIDGRFVVFGEGNLLSYQTAACCNPQTQNGLIAVIHVRAVGRRSTVTRVDYVPTRVRFPEYVVVPVGRRLNQLVAEGRGSGREARVMLTSDCDTVSHVGHSTWTHPLPPIGDTLAGLRTWGRWVPKSCSAVRR
jgi:poly-gamma-glutamate synthesis protein (capsule biosynthesis protein)